MTNIYYTPEDIEFVREHRRKVNFKRNHKRKRVDNCTCNNLLCNQTFYRTKGELQETGKHYCSIKCLHEGKTLFLMIGTVTLFKDGKRSGTASFYSKEHLKELMETMYCSGRIETYYEVKFKN